MIKREISGIIITLIGFVISLVGIFINQLLVWGISILIIGMIIIFNKNEDKIEQRKDVKGGKK